LWEARGVRLGLVRELHTVILVVLAFKVFAVFAWTAVVWLKWSGSDLGGGMND